MNYKMLIIACLTHQFVVSSAKKEGVRPFDLARIPRVLSLVADQQQPEIDRQSPSIDPAALMPDVTRAQHEAVRVDPVIQQLILARLTEQTSALQKALEEQTRVIKNLLQQLAFLQEDNDLLRRRVNDLAKRVKDR